MTLPQPFRQASVAWTASIAVVMTVAMFAFSNIGTSWDVSESTMLFVDNTLGIGVNLLCISVGYCGLRLSWKSIIMLVLVALCYDAVNLALVVAAGSWLPVWDTAAASVPNLISTALTMLFFPVSSMPCRLMHAYLFMLILAPLINRGLAALGTPRLRSFLIILTASVVLCGWMAENYLAWWQWDLYYFLYLYVVGYFLRTTPFSSRFSRRTLLRVGAAAIVGLAAAIYIHDFLSGPWIYWFTSGHANNVFSLTASVAAFMAATRSSASPYRGPNWLATAIFGTLMLITGPATTMLMDSLELSLTSPLMTFVSAILCATAFAALIAWAVYEPLLLAADVVSRHIPRLTVTPPAKPLMPDSAVRRSSQRNSSIELARILAMSMILIEHLTFSKVTPGFEGYASWGIIICGFASCCVSVYVMLLGVLGLRLTWKYVINIWLTVWLFNLLSVIFIAIFDSLSAHYFTPTDVVKSLIFPIGSSHYWFIKAYLIILTLAPLVNAGLQCFDLRSLRVLVILLSCAGIYCGWLGQNPLNDMLNYWGEGYVTAIFPADITFFFLWLYVVGWWMSRDAALRRIPTLGLAVGFFATTLLQGVLHLFTLDPADIQGSFFSPYQRQGLLVSLSAFFLVCFFMRFSFHDRRINFLGAVSLGCYLIQDSYPGFMLYDFEKNFFDTHGFSPALWGLLAASFLGTWLLAAIIFYYKRRWLPPLVDRIIACLPQNFKKQLW